MCGDTGMTHFFRKPGDLVTFAAQSDRKNHARDTLKRLLRCFAVVWVWRICGFLLTACFGDIYRPIGSMFGIFTYIYHENQPNASKYAIHRWYERLTLLQT